MVGEIVRVLRVAQKRRVEPEGVIQQQPGRVPRRPGSLAPKALGPELPLAAFHSRPVTLSERAHVLALHRMIVPGQFSRGTA